MANDPTSALASLDEAITAHEAADYSGARAKVIEARDYVDEVPALAAFFTAYLDGGDSDLDYGQPAGDPHWDHGTEAVGKFRGPTIDTTHGLRVLRGRVALQNEDPPVFGAVGS